MKEEQDEVYVLGESTGGKRIFYYQPDNVYYPEFEAGINCAYYEFIGEFDPILISVVGIGEIYLGKVPLC
ncbi:MAG: hypothetical protein EZS28_004000 [Streblomastix strix]|uniref:Uncharacterized protein n=1 Tax=Streblomastix strix TaxID=222440 RepID=A0A5J4WZQ5_9EUKA|nr:MAG: hypothetical protein EZS28_004000 [Streblomastix strix]